MNTEVRLSSISTWYSSSAQVKGVMPSVNSGIFPVRVTLMLTMAGCRMKYDLATREIPLPLG
jgi:hypothetical protein